MKYLLRKKVPDTVGCNKCYFKPLGRKCTDAPPCIGEPGYSYVYIELKVKK